MRWILYFKLDKRVHLFQYWLNQSTNQPINQSIVKKSAFSQIIDQIKDQIQNGSLKPGDQLPPERQFSEMMNVNRHTVREALKVLEYMGVVEGKTGIGTFVKNIGQDLLVDQITYAAEFSPKLLLTELIELRYSLEPGIAALAAEKVTKNDLQIMKETMNDFQDEFKKGALGTDADERLHIALANATQNRTIVRLTKPILAMLSQYREKSLEFENRRAETFREHKQIFRAIKQKDPEGARKAMMYHLKQVAIVIKS